MIKQIQILNNITLPYSSVLWYIGVIQDTLHDGKIWSYVWTGPESGCKYSYVKCYTAVNKYNSERKIKGLGFNFKPGTVDHRFKQWAQRGITALSVVFKN